MITRINNYIPSFKKAYIKDDSSRKNIDDVFNTNFKKKAFQHEMAMLYKMSGSTDIFLSAQQADENDNGERVYELKITDKNDKTLVMGMMVSNKDSAILLNSTLAILNNILKPQLEDKY